MNKTGYALIRCNLCGRPIKFLKRKNMKHLPVNPGLQCFTPDDKHGEIVFATEKGEVRKGFVAIDGIRGYVLHKCDRGDKYAAK